MKISAKRKDELALLGTGIVCAAGAWLFWWYFQNAAFDILLAILIFSLWCDNRRLRAQLKQRDGAGK